MNARFGRGCPTFVPSLAGLGFPSPGRLVSSSRDSRGTNSMSDAEAPSGSIMTNYSAGAVGCWRGPDVGKQANSPSIQMGARPTKARLHV